MHYAFLSPGYSVSFLSAKFLVIRKNTQSCSSIPYKLEKNAQKKFYIFVRKKLYVFDNKKLTTTTKEKLLGIFNVSRPIKI